MKLLSAILVVFASISMAMATPIHPDIKKLLSTPRPTQHFAPARVGWNGPEAAPSPVAAQLGSASQTDMRRTLLKIATPDWRIFLALGALIILLRMLKSRDPRAFAPARYPVLVDVVEPESQRPAA